MKTALRDRLIIPSKEMKKLRTECMKQGINSVTLHRLINEGKNVQPATMQTFCGVLSSMSEGIVTEYMVKWSVFHWNYETSKITTKAAELEPKV